MQTLIFLKDRIIAKLAQLFPEMGIVELVGRPGKIPAEVEKLINDAEWPDWQKENKIEFIGISDPELVQQLERCQQKQQARVRGLKERGLVLCKTCQAAMTASGKGVCVMCHFAERSASLAKVKTVLHDMPWLSHEELLEFDPELDSGEYLGTRLSLLQDSLELVREMAAELSLDFSEQGFRRMKKEMARAAMLHSCKMPDQVDIYNLLPGETPDPQWQKYLAVFPEEDEC
jgi:hypothetical protein